MSGATGADTRSDTQFRRAVIDIGSNTVRLVVFGGPPRAPVTILNEKVTARLGRELAESGSIPGKARRMALAALARFRLLVSEMGLEDVETVATAAVRDADNGQAFLAEVEALGLSSRLLSGGEEAVTSALGVIGAFPGADGIVADLGGGSLELVEIGDGEATHGLSLPLGTLRLPKLRGQGAEAFEAAVRRMMAEADYEAQTGQHLFLVGGTPRAFARYAMEMTGSPLDDPHGLGLDPALAMELCAEVARAKPKQLEKLPGIASSRAAMLPDAAALLRVVIAELAPRTLRFSAWGLREGLLYRKLDPVARRLDPLLAGVSAFTAQHGIPLSAAATIVKWSAAATPKAEEAKERLRLAATMLALASVQLEPNLRRGHLLDWALHKRWIGIGPADRAMLGATLLGATGRCNLPARLLTLAPADLLEEGVIWGLAIRLARRLAASTTRPLEETRLGFEAGMLTLFLSERLAALHAGPVDKDLRLLAERMGCGWKVVVAPEG